MSNGVASANAAAAAAVVGAFRAAGGTRAVVSPGSRSTPLVQALAGTDLDVRVVLDERTAAFIAVGAARSDGRPVLLVCTSGSAGAHYGPAAAEAIEAGLPLWLVTADRPPELHGIGAPQTTRQHDWYGGNIARIVVAAADEVDPTELAGRVTAAAPDAGPLHLNIGFREPLVADRVPRIDVAPVLRPAAIQPCPTPPAEDLDRAARPLIVLGPEAEGLWLPGGWERWAQEADVPVVADVLAGTAAGLRGLDGMLRDEALREALQPDVVMQFGRLPTSKALGQWLARCEAEGVPVWHVSPDQRPHAWRPSDRVVTGPIAAPDVAPQSTPGWTATWQALATAVSGITLDPGFWEAHIWRALAQALPDGATVLAGSSMAVRDAD
ncbi:MAG: 2-succinyl-5-enolpyruvyl-6-hydroxy-3-cyclohexene-1-carboxylic-acid synthase, partial [Candidatus Dadabacteria bacterium]